VSSPHLTGTAPALPRLDYALSGVVAALVGGAVAFPVDPSGVDAGLSVALAVVLTLAAALGDPAGTAGKVHAAGVALLGTVAVLARLDEPAAGLALAIGTLAAAGRPLGLFHPSGFPTVSIALARTTAVAAGVGLLALSAPRTIGVPSQVVAVLVGLTPVLAAGWDLRRRAAYPLAFAVGAAIAVIVGVAVLASGLRVGAMGTVPLVVALSPVPSTSIRRADEEPAGLFEALTSSTATLLVSTFAFLGAAGAALLLIPAAQRTPGALAPIDAAFTSVSATCVTGLGVVDTWGTFTGFGQLVLLGLIQVGGLGIMTFATAAAIYGGQRLGVQQEIVTAELLGGDARKDLRRALRDVLWVTFGTELAGAALLFPAFWLHGDPVGRALWRALFTSVSAFCNAGFALQGDSLVSYQTDPFVLGVVGALITVGGLGPAVIVAVPMLLRGRGRLHARLVLVTSAALVLVPALLMLPAEWNHSMAHLSVPSKVTNALFQSVTLRTAGFNSVDLTQIHPATWTVMIVAMFIGGSPASTAGGAKTTTMAVLALSLLAVARGRPEVTAFARRIPHKVVYEATAISALGVGSAITALVALQLTQRMSTEVALFEVVSALGTVGLTVGGTGHLDTAGKIIVMLCMFAGRVGPLTVFLFLAGRSQRAGQRYALESVQVG
jgi:trk system potassium uptake protein TrkH